MDIPDGRIAVQHPDGIGLFSMTVGVEAVYHLAVMCAVVADGERFFIREEVYLVGSFIQICFAVGFEAAPFFRDDNRIVGFGIVTGDFEPRTAGIVVVIWGTLGPHITYPAVVSITAVTVTVVFGDLSFICGTFETHQIGFAFIILFEITCVDQVFEPHSAADFVG